MLSYQHIYHAGNFADVHKHATLIAWRDALRRRPQPLFLLDTHAGRGRYDLTATEAQKTGERHDGIGAVWALTEHETPVALRPYRAAVAALNPGGTLVAYPGSAQILHTGLRPGDVLIAVEKHPGEFRSLRSGLGADGRGLKLEPRDGLDVLAEVLPPTPPRGLVVIDPSYEIKAEYDTIPRALQQAWKRWPRGGFLLWYPLLNAGGHERLRTILCRAAIPDVLISEIVREDLRQKGAGIWGSGLALINPPEGMKTILTEIGAALSWLWPGTTARQDWLDAGAAKGE